MIGLLDFYLVSETERMTNLASNLFAYLHELTSLRHKVIRSVDDYMPFVLWFADIPCEKECLTPAWYLTEENNVPEDIWLMVKKPKAPHMPALPVELRQWVDESQLNNVSNLPEPRKRIDKPGSPGEFIEFADVPNLEKIWMEYLDKSWLPWAEEIQRVSKIQKVYTTLHEIYQEKKKLGEQYELLLGIGLLCWNTPNNQKVKRHLIVAEADIVLDANKGTITVGPGIGSAGERAKTTFEQEMVEANQRPSPDVQNEIERHISEIGNNIWNSELVDSALKKWIEEVSSSSESIYSRTISKPDEIKRNPTINLAPCLILRKRTERGLLKILDDISRKLLDQGKIPENICKISGLNIQSEERKSEISAPNLNIEEIYFPLPWNDEQVKIVEHLNRRNAVLVQGPPGTGKSHTIVNLICHLLAEGKRILVTSQTPRALRVLQDMMENKEETRSIASLCVSILGSDSKSLKNLEKSVHSISDKQYSWNSQENKQRIKALADRWDNLRREEARLQTRLRELRCSETEQQSILSGRYKGTLQQIAIRLFQEKSEYRWIQDKSIDGDEPPLSNQEINDLLTSLRYFTNERVKENVKEIPGLSDLPTVESFIRYSDYERQTKANLDRHEYVIKQPIYSYVSRTSEENRMALIDILKRFISEKENIEKHIKPWSQKALDEILAEQDRGWRVLLENTKSILAGLAKSAKIADQTKIHSENMRENRNRTTVLSDARQLHNYFINGGKIKALFNPKEVKNAMYLIKNTRIDGRLCDNKDSLKLLIECLETDEKLEMLWNYWAHIEKRSQRSRAEQVAIVEDLCEPIEASLNLYNIMIGAREICRNVAGLPEPTWRDTASIKLYIEAAETVVYETNLRKFYVYFGTYEDKLKLLATNQRHHEICDQILATVRNRDTKSYSALIEQLKTIEREKHRFARMKEMLVRLRAAAPGILKDMVQNREDPAWEGKLAIFDESWYWVIAESWIKERLDRTIRTDLNIEIERVQKQIKQVVGEIASKLAWGHCLERLSRDESLSQHLVGWSQAVRKYGKGTGKWAFKHLSDARYHMEECRTAIPAWIMPLYRVADSVKPEKGAYDVAIIDEASQSGPEALFIFYIAKKVVVVGDDKQISPEDVGIPLEDTIQMQNKYIKDYAHKDAFGTQSSLFDIAARFSDRIVLREHFRCMPEIIQFSNNLCYSNTPLIPLRQYPPGRLDPIKHVHVREGYRVGVASDAINSPEAVEIVKTIKQCCDDPAYQGKSMGVITLLGNRQSALIDKLLLENIPPETIEKRNIVCGNPYAFQGDERDIIFLSMVAASNVTMSALTRQSDVQRFNVAASRAKDQIWLFHTPMLNDFRNNECLRYKLLSYYMNPRVECAVGSIEKCESEFERDVFQKIAERGFRVIPQFHVAGYYIDLVVQGMKGQLAVECDGDYWHGPDQYDRDMARQRMLERCGWTFFRIRGSEFYRYPDSALDPLWKKLEELKIAPGGQDIEPPPHADDAAEVDVEEEKAVDIYGQTDSIDEENNNSVDKEEITDRDSVNDSLYEDEDKNEKNISPIEIYGSEVSRYSDWKPIECNDPRFEDVNVIKKKLIEIIQIEGPMRAIRAYHLYVKASGIQKVGKQIRSVLNRALQKAVSEGSILMRDEGKDKEFFMRVVRSKEAPEVVIRSRGSRDLSEIPPAEIASVIRLIRKKNPNKSEQMLFRKVLEFYEIRRFTNKAHEILQNVWSQYKEPIIMDEDL